MAEKNSSWSHLVSLRYAFMGITRRSALFITAGSAKMPAIDD
ncbi:hypothetical protein [Erwinia billingiae]|jgi:hypothetical protein|nr:hypothetical protein [Erwinia billingiae]